MKRITCLLLILLMAGCFFAFAAGNRQAEGRDGTVTLTYYGFSEWVATGPWARAYADAKAQFERENPGFRIELQSDP